METAASETFMRQPRNRVILIYLLTAVGLTPGGSSTVHIYTQTIHRTKKKNNTKINWNSAGRAPSW
jgi:hypothetical protein